MNIVLDTTNHKEPKFQKWLKDNNISFKVLRTSGPGGGCPEIKYSGSKKDLEKMIDKYYHDEELKDFIEGGSK